MAIAVRTRLSLVLRAGLMAALAFLLSLGLPALVRGDDPSSEPPAVPTGLIAQVAYDQVSLSWDDPDDDSVTGYRILRRNRATDDPGVFHTIEDDTGTASTSYLDSDVEAEARYVYRIKAKNQHGLSAQSTYVDVYTPAPPLPAEPTGLTVTVLHDSVSLGWDDPDDDSITGYRILRRNRATDDPGVFPIHVQDTGNPGTSYTDTNVEAETRYVYRIKAINDRGLGERSSWFDADTPAAPAPVVPTPVPSSETQ